MQGPLCAEVAFVRIGGELQCCGQVRLSYELPFKGSEPRRMCQPFGSQGMTLQLDALRPFRD